MRCTKYEATECPNYKDNSFDVGEAAIIRVYNRGEINDRGSKLEVKKT